MRSLHFHLSEMRLCESVVSFALRRLPIRDGKFEVEVLMWVELTCLGLTRNPIIAIGVENGSIVPRRLPCYEHVLLLLLESNVRSDLPLEWLVVIHIEPEVIVLLLVVRGLSLA